MFYLYYHIFCLQRALKVFFIRWFIKLSTIRRKPSRIVLLIRDDLLGDFLLSGNALKTLYDYYHAKGYHVILVCKEQNRPLAEGAPFKDECFYLPGKCTFMQRLTIYRQLYRYHAEYAIKLPCVFGSSIHPVLYAIMSDARHTLGYTPVIPDMNSQTLSNSISSKPSASCSRKLFNKLFNAQQQLLLTNAKKYHPFRKIFNIQLNPRQSVVEIEAELVSKITGHPCTPRLLAPDWLPLESLDKLDLPGTYYVLIPGASNSQRQWSTDNFAHVIRQFAATHPELTPIVCGIQKESRLAETIIALCPGISCLNLCGKTSISQMYCLLKQAQFSLANDTGTAHLATLAGIPTIILLGGGHYGLYAPLPMATHTVYTTCEDHSCFGCYWKCHKTTDGTLPCVQQISLEKVQAAMEAAWEKRNRP